MGGLGCAFETFELFGERHCTDTMTLYLESKALGLRKARQEARPKLYINWNQESCPASSLLILR